MNKYKKLAAFLLIVSSLAGFYIIVADAPSMQASVAASPYLCDEGRDKYCWISFPSFWTCLTYGGERCVGNPR